MTSVPELLTRPIYRAFVSTRCACGQHKKTHTALCRACFFALPADVRGKLSLRFAAGFEDVYSAALALLRTGGRVAA